MENMNLSTLVKISKYKSSHKLNRGPKSLDRLRGHPLLSLITSERGPFRALKMRPVRQEAVHSLWSRLFCGPLKMRRVPEEAVFGTEYLFRTVEGGFWYGALPKTHRTWLSGAQESGWQLPLRGLSTPRRGRGKGPPETSSALAGRRKWRKGPERTK